MTDTFAVETFKEDGEWHVFVPQIDGRRATTAETFSLVEHAAREFIAHKVDRSIDSVQLSITITSAKNDELTDRMHRLAYELMGVIEDLKDRPGAENYDFSTHRAGLNQIMAHLLGAHQDTL